MTDTDYLKQAVEVGRAGQRPYGAVIVVDCKVIASDHSYVLEHNDPSAHAEVTAIRTACEKLSSRKLHGATLYASHEPCLMCFACAAFAEIDRVVFVIPASNDNATYGFRGGDIFTLAQNSLYPIKVEQMDL